MSLDFLGRGRRATVPSAPQQSTAVGGVLNPPTTAAAPAGPVNPLMDLQGGVTYPSAVSPPAPARTHNHFPFNYGLQNFFGGADDLIGRLTHRMLASRGF